MASDFLMARQPILDRNGSIYAYELLYRAPDFTPGVALDLDTEFRSLMNVLFNVGLDRLVHSKLAFFNVSPQLLDEEATRLLPPGRVVLELLEETEWNDDTIERIKELHRDGYQIAYDDFTFERHQLPFVGNVDMLKIDIASCDWSIIEAGIPRLLQRGTKLLAEKVEDRATYKRCYELGFHYFQGYYFARPETVSSKAVNPCQQAALRLLFMLNRQEVSAGELEEAIGHDAGLAVRILQLVNSAALRVPRKIDSIRTAIQMLGIHRLQTLATVIVAASVGKKEAQAAAELGLVRARMCQDVAIYRGLMDPHKMFTIGLLSVLDGMMDLPMDQIIPELGLSDDVSEVLMNPGSQTPEADLLRWVQAYERGDWAAMMALRSEPISLLSAYDDPMNMAA